MTTKRVALNCALTLLIAAAPGALVLGQVAPSASSLVAEGARPMARAADLLEARYGWTISYEDPPVDSKGGRLEVERLPAVARDSDAPALFERLVLADQAAGESTLFRLLSSNGRFQIVATDVISGNGQWKPVSSILDVPVTITVEERTGSELLLLLCHQLSEKGGALVMPGVTPANDLSKLRLRAGVSRQPAREVLQELLDQIPGQGWRWRLMYSGNAYALNIGQAQRPRAVGSAPERAALLQLQTTRNVELSLRRLAAWFRFPVGIELVDGALGDDTSSVAPNGAAAPVDLAGLSSANALDRILDRAPDYRWDDVNGVVLVRPVRRVVNSWLDRTFPSFEIKNATIQEALDATQRLIDPRHPNRSPTAPLPRAMAGRVEFGTSTRPASISLKNPTLWQILNEIAVAYPGIGWTFENRSNRRGIAEFRIGLFGWEGRSVAAVFRIPDSERTPAEQGGLPP